MVAFNINYMTPGIMEIMGPEPIIIMAADEKGAEGLFKLFHPDKAFFSAVRLWLHTTSNNGRYSRYFTNKK